MIHIKKISFLLFSMLLLLFGNGVVLSAAQSTLSSDVPLWRTEWPRTDFSKRTDDLSGIRSGGPPKDGIPSIDNPLFGSIPQNNHLGSKEPVIAVTIENKTRAYPIRLLIYHEIVNDVLAGIPIAVTYCPLCNAALVFDRRVQGVTLSFGTTGKLRNSDMIMYDRQSESWWQQFTGQSFVGAFAGTSLTILPSSIRSFSSLAKDHPEAEVLMPHNPNLRPYGKNPYIHYDTAQAPFLFDGNFDEAIPAMERVVAIGKHAWPLSRLRTEKAIKCGDLVLQWEDGQASPLDTETIKHGRDVGNVLVHKTGDPSQKLPVIYHLPFAFAFKAFVPDGIFHITNNEDIKECPTL